MPERDEVLLVVQQWVQKAENDLQAATYMLRLGEGCPTDTVCFYAQQCVEKYVKALFALHAIEFPRTHNLGVLIARLPQALRPQLTPEEQELLTDYATTTRYPGDSVDSISHSRGSAGAGMARTQPYHASNARCKNLTPNPQ